MSVLDEATTSLQRMQQFDVQTLPRREELGESFDFDDVVAPAQRLIDLYKRLSTSALQDFPDKQQKAIQQIADADYQKFNQILTFDPAEDANPKATHGSHVQQVVAAYQPAFDALHPMISYSLHRSADFQRLDTDARATLQRIEDSAGEITKDLEAKQTQADRVLSEIREVAAEQGVTQQAEYFKGSADSHEAQAETYRTRTRNLAIWLGLYSFASLFIHNIPGLEATNDYRTVQVAVSKVLIFSVLSFMLFLAARNFLASRHNAIVDRHRQNALLTYKALVEAAGDTPNRELILVQAASCIFGPQATGFAKESGQKPPGATSLIELVSKQVTGGSPE